MAAQKEYYSAQHNEYAKEIFSDEGQHNGLYWKAAEGEPQSPVGPLVASAFAKDYAKSQIGAAALSATGAARAPIFGEVKHLGHFANIAASRSVDSERFLAPASFVTDVPSQLSGDCESPTEFLVLE